MGADARRGRPLLERVLAKKSDLQSAAVAPGPLLDELLGGVYPEKQS